MKKYLLTPQTALKGHSLLELTVACAILGCLVMVSFSGLQGMIPSARVNRASRELATLLEWARWQAVRHGMHILEDHGEFAFALVSERVGHASIVENVSNYFCGWCVTS